MSLRLATEGPCMGCLASGPKMAAQRSLACPVSARGGSLETTQKLQVQVRSMDRWSVHATELIGIFYAINIINKVTLQRRRLTGVRVRSTTILSDSMSALQAIQIPGNKSRQRIIHAILQAARNTKTHGIAVRLQWMPRHCEAPGNDTADRLAEEAALLAKATHFPLDITREGPH